MQAIKESLGSEQTPEEIFYYTYAVLFSPTYRKRYEEFLKIDFPSVPLPSGYDVFKELSIVDASLPINKLGKILEKGYVENYSWPRIVKPTSDYPFFGMGIILPPLSIDYKTLRAKQKTRQKNLNFKNLQKI